MSPLSSTFTSLRHRNFRLFFFGQLVSFIGVWMQNVAQSWLVYELTHSRLLLGLVYTLGSLPILAFSLYGGTLADRADKRKLLLFTQSSAMVMAWLLGILIAFDWIRIWHIFVLATLLGLDTAIDTPTRQSFLFEMVGKEDLTNAIALNSTIFNASRIIGPAVAGLLISAVGLSSCFFLNGLTYLAILAALFSMRFEVERVRPSSKSSILHGLSEVLRYAGAHPPIRSLLLLLAIISIFALQYVVMMPVFAKDILGGGPRTLGALMTAIGVGALIGALNLATYGNRRGRTLLLLLGAILFLLSLFLFTLSTHLYLSLFLLVLVGFFMITFLATANTLLQITVSDELRGRIMGLFVMALLGMVPLGSLQLGFLAQHLGAPWAIRIGTALCMLSWLALLPQLRQIEHMGREGKSILFGGARDDWDLGEEEDLSGR
ncbi:MAG: MFS transporter [candidate division NC10 bacterium]|nr:MFS transporter [candidate division NC10 bacterium]